MLDFLPKRSTITGVYYANLLDQLRTAIREKLSKDVLLQQDNPRVHTCKVAMDVVEGNRYELIPHPAFSPDLAPSDFFLFLPASVAQLDGPSDWRPGGRGFNPRRGRQHSFVEIDHEIFSTVILSLLLIQEGQLSVSGEGMCTILVNHIED